MRLLLDENVALPLSTTIKNFFEGLHEITHVLDLDGWQGTKDKQLWPMAADHGFSAVLTNDAKQMQRQHEVEAIAASGVHRIQYPHKHPGLMGIGLAIATVCASLPTMLETLDATSQQQLVTLTGIDPTPASRFRVLDPAKSPPKYWPAATA